MLLAKAPASSKVQEWVSLSALVSALLSAKVPASSKELGWAAESDCPEGLSASVWAAAAVLESTAQDLGMPLARRLGPGPVPLSASY